MWTLKRSQVLPIGVDIGHDSIKLLQLEVRKTTSIDGQETRIAVVAAAREELSNEARSNPSRRLALAAVQIKKMLAQQPFVGRRLIATLPRDVLHTRVLRLKPAPVDELEAALHAECKALFPFEMKDACVEFFSAGEVRQGKENRQEVIVLAARRTDVSNSLAQLNEGGFAVTELETETSALHRASEHSTRSQRTPFDIKLVIDVGARRSQVLIAKGPQILFYRPIEIGGLHLLDSVTRKLSITTAESRALRNRLTEREDSVTIESSHRKDSIRQAVFDATRTVADELAQELEKCLRYFHVAFRGRHSIQVLLSGGEALDHQLLTAIQTQLGLPVTIAEPLEGIDIQCMRPADRRGPNAVWTLATGLCLKFAHPTPAPSDSSMLNRRDIAQSLVAAVQN